MKHTYHITKIPAIADEKYQPQCLPLGYVEGIKSGGGDIVEIGVAILADQLCGLTKRLIQNYEK